jgi:hypothetical protein
VRCSTSSTRPSATRDEAARHSKGFNSSPSTRGEEAGCSWGSA